LIFVFPPEMKPRNHLKIGLLLWLCLSAIPSTGRAEWSETSGTVTFEAEQATQTIPRVLSGITYTWSVSNNLGGFSGTGFVQALPDDETSVTADWTTTAPELRFTVNFSNTGTYHVWLRGYAETQDNARVYVGLNGASPQRLDLPQSGVWSWSNTAAASTQPVTIRVDAPGPQTFNVWMGDSGFRLDRILLTRNPNYSPDFRADFWRNQSIYQIITDRFFDGDPSNNNVWGSADPTVGNKTHGGDFKGIEQKLDYIKALGATAIWISPVLLNGKGDFDYHGYAATDFYKVDPRFGTLTDLQRLVAESHRRGLLVINDVVVNHASTWVDSAESGWPDFKYPPDGYNLRYNSGGRTYAHPFDPTSLQAAFGTTDLRNIFNNNGTTQNWGDATQVELGELLSLDDFRTQSSYVRQRMSEIWTYWLQTVGFDAYRIDTVKHVEMGFWDTWSPAIREAARVADKPNFFQFGEIYDGSDTKVGSYTGSKTTGVFKMESAIDYPLYYQIGSVFATGTGSTGQIESRYGNLTTANYDAGALDALILNLDNHDQRRFLNYGGGTARLDVALTFLYTSRGIPALYYGTEQDFDGGEDPFNREDMFDGQFEYGPSLGDNFNMTHPRFKRVAKLNNLRRLYPALRTGNHVNLWANFSGPGLFAYARRLGNQEAYVVLNTATSSQNIAARPTIHPAGTVLVNVLNPAETVTVISGTDGIPAMTIPALSSKIFVAQAQAQALDPVVESINPVHDATGISTSTAITLAFDRAMDAAAVQNAFSTVPATTGSFVWSNDNTTVTYTPSSVLLGNTLHTVRLDDTAADTGGLALHAPFESRFTTGASASVSRPSVNTSQATAVDDTTATLATSVQPNGAGTTVSFEYGPTSAYGTSTASQSIGSGTASVDVTANLSGLTPGLTYNFRVVAANSAGTTFGPNTTFTTTSSGPQLSVTTFGPSFVTTNGASLNGRINPGGSPASHRFVYGTQPNVLDQATSWTDAGSGTADLDVFARVENLQPGTTYFYALEASNGDLTVQGSVQSVTTLPVKPTIISSSALNPNPSGATLQAVVNPNGFETTVTFEYGTSEEYGSTTATVTIPAGTSDTPVEAPVTGLEFGRTYNFRAVAENANGITYGVGSTFVTGNPPPSVVTEGAGNVTVDNATASASIAARVNPNGEGAGTWIEYGTTTDYGTTTRKISADDAESYASFSYSAPNNNGGTGFGTFSNYTQTGGNRGNVILVTSSSGSGTGGRQLSGAKSFGVTAGTSTATRGIQSGYRPVLEARQYGVFGFAMRFDVDNTKGFSGLSLKSERGSSFGAGELLSLGMRPLSNDIGGNNVLVVSDASGQHTLDFGSESRGAIFDAQIDFDTVTGLYRLTVTRRAGNVTRQREGRLKLAGASISLAGVGYINSNNSGAANQNLIFDNLAIDASRGIGNGKDDVNVTESITGLAANSLYHFRAAAANASGFAYGDNITIFTGTDLLPVIVPAAGLRQGEAGQIAVTIRNAGTVATSGGTRVILKPPAGWQILEVNAAGWSLNNGGLDCSRSDTLPGGEDYPAIALTVAVPPDAPASNIFEAVLENAGGDAQPDNNTAISILQVEPNVVLGILDQWRLQYFGSAEANGPTANDASFSGDGVPNLFKFAMGLDPTQKVTFEERPSVIAENNIFSVRFRRAKAAEGVVTVKVMATGDVAAPFAEELWNSNDVPYGGGEAESEIVTVEDPVPIDTAPGGHRFLRLEVSQP
jgi:alpha-amylase